MLMKGRGQQSPLDLQYKQVIAKNLHSLTNQKKLKQVDVSKGTSISISTLNGYYQGQRLPSPGNVQKLADFFNVNKSDIDPRFRQIGISDDQKVSLKKGNQDEDTLEAIVNSFRSWKNIPVTDEQRAAIKASVSAMLDAVTGSKSSEKHKNTHK